MQPSAIKIILEHTAKTILEHTATLKNMSNFQKKFGIVWDDDPELVNDKICLQFIQKVNNNPNLTDAFLAAKENNVRIFATIEFKVLLEGVDDWDGESSAYIDMRATVGEIIKFLLGDPPEQF